MYLLFSEYDYWSCSCRQAAFTERPDRTTTTKKKEEKTTDVGRRRGLWWWSDPICKFSVWSFYLFKNDYP